MKAISKKINSVNFKIKLAGDNGFHLIPISEHDVQSIINVYHRIKPIKLLGVIDIIPSLVNILIVNILTNTTSIWQYKISVSLYQ